MEAKPLAWITGAGGLIGHHLILTAAQWGASWQVTGLTREQLDLTEANQVRAQFKRHHPQLVIHCAALSRSPACQAHPALARKINVEATALLTELAADIPFIFLSTDLVFDGRAGNYEEDAAVNPLSVYGETKVQAERIVLSNPKHLVFRCSLNGGISPTGDRGFNEQLRRSWQEGQTPTLFTDEYRSPLPAAETAHALWSIAANNQPGLYHLAGAERLSRWEIGQLVAARWPQLNPRITAGSIHEYQGTPRPGDTTLNCRKIQKWLPFKLSGFSEWLKAHPAEVF